MTFRLVPKSVTLNDLERRNGRSRSFKVSDFHTNRKLICDFILVINTNLIPILYRFRDIAYDRSLPTLPLLCLTPPMEGLPWDDLRKMFRGCQRLARVTNAVQILPKLQLG